MKTYPIHDSQGQLFAFEVPNWRIGRRCVSSVVQRIPGATLTRRPRFLSWFREDVFCEFEVDGATYVAEEPWGDSSRYWIGPEPPRWLPQTERVHRAFADS